MYIVTGGAGFIGSAFVWKLNQEGIDDILIVDNLGTADKWKNLVNLRFNDYMHKDDFFYLANSAEKMPFGKVDAIIHLGACSSTTERDAEYLMSNNFLYTKTVANKALSEQIRFIYASSAATYGDGAEGFADDEKTALKLKPINMYGYSKQLFDLWAISNGLTDKIVGVKFFNVFGPNEYHKDDMRSVVHKSFEQIKNTGEVALFKSYRQEFADGGQLRDFVYVKDCVDILWKMLRDKSVCGIFNLGTGKARSWNDLVGAVFVAMGVKKKIKYIDIPASIIDQYQYYTQADMMKLSKALKGKLSFATLEDAVGDYVKNYLAKNNKYLS